MKDYIKSVFCDQSAMGGTRKDMCTYLLNHDHGVKAHLSRGKYVNLVFHFFPWPCWANVSAFSTQSLHLETTLAKQRWGMSSHYPLDASFDWSDYRKLSRFVHVKKKMSLFTLSSVHEDNYSSRKGHTMEK